MAYNVSNDYRTIVYSGGAIYDCQLKVNNVQVPNSQIQSIKISSPIIDTSSEVFHIGTFISQSIEIKFKNLDGLDFTTNPLIELSIGMQVDNAYEYVPIGKYLIDELAENYQQTCTITAMDYAIKFKSNIDISKFFNRVSTTENQTQIHYAYAYELFESICGYYGVQVGTYPNVNNNKKIYFYDDSLTGKQYIMYLAELFGGNAKIERNGSCSIIPLKNYTNIEINALTSKKFEIGDTYQLSRVCYDNGKVKYQANINVISVSSLPLSNIDLNSYYYLTTQLKYYKYENNQWNEIDTIKNTLYIKTENLFITQQEDIDNIYNAVKDFSVTNITCENRMDFSLDCWDIVTYTDGTNTYNTFYDNTINFNGVAMGTVKVNIPLKFVEETTNVIANNVNDKIRKIQTTIDEQNLSIATTVALVDEQNSKISTVEQTVNELNSKISDIADITVSQETNEARLSFEGINQSEPIRIEVHPIVTNISYLYPRNNLYPSDTLYLTNRKIRFTNINDNIFIDYELPIDLLYYNSENYDEFILDYDSQTCIVNKKVGYNADGSVYLLSSPQTLSFNYPTIPLTDGDYTVELLGYNIGYLFVRLMSQNIYTTQFATKVEMNSAIEQSASQINLRVEEKLDEEDFTSANILLKINDDESSATIKADKINLNGVVTANENFKIKSDGSMEAYNGKFIGGEIELTGSDNIPKITINGTSANKKINIGSNYWEIYDSNGDVKVNAGLNSIGQSFLNVDDTSIWSGTGITTPNVTQTSLETEKKNFEKFNNGLDIIKDIDIYKYNLKAENDETKKHIGFVIGDKYKYSKEITSNNNDGVDIYSFVSVCCRAIQEQQEQIETLKKEIKKLGGNE